MGVRSYSIRNVNMILEAESTKFLKTLRHCSQFAPISQPLTTLKMGAVTVFCRIHLQKFVTKKKNCSLYEVFLKLAGLFTNNIAVTHVMSCSGWP